MNNKFIINNIINKKELKEKEKECKKIIDFEKNEIKHNYEKEIIFLKKINNVNKTYTTFFLIMIDGNILIKYN